MIVNFFQHTEVETEHSFIYYSQSTCLEQPSRLILSQISWSSLYYDRLLLLQSYRHICQSQQLNFIIQTLFIFTCLGSGGNNHAVDYYKETNYPLAVKLGTITPDGAGIAVYYVITSLPFNSLCWT